MDEHLAKPYSAEQIQAVLAQAQELRVPQAAQRPPIPPDRLALVPGSTSFAQMTESELHGLQQLLYFAYNNCSSVPIFQQIIEEIRALIAQGSLKSGEKLPSGRLWPPVWGSTCTPCCGRTPT